MNNRLSEKASITLLYHDIFDYPIKERELEKWAPSGNLKLIKVKPRIEFSREFYYLKDREEIIKRRIERENASRMKMKILSRAKPVFEGISDILMVGITGSLAMSAASGQSDIDLIIITKRKRLWGSRLRALLSLIKHKIAVRRAGVNKEGDKLCLNIWMDESDLIINERNAYTAHELAQIVPLINRENAYERLLAANKWILDYWPNSVASSMKYVAREKQIHSTFYFLHATFEKLAYLLQCLYMSRKITREVVTPTRAFFHPFDWSKKVNQELERRGVLDKNAKSS